MIEPNYWWHNNTDPTTRKNHFDGGYIWAPLRTTGDIKIRFFENFREVKIGDLIVANGAQLVESIATVASVSRLANKPVGYASPSTDAAGWINEGRMIAVEWREIPAPFSPRENIDRLWPHLPDNYRPLRKDGSANSCWLTKIDKALFDEVISIGQAVCDLADVNTPRLNSDIANIIRNTALTETKRLQLISARIGQGAFRQAVLALNGQCRVTGISNPALLRASHIKPWRDCEAGEHTDENNGLALAAHVDLLFDQYLMTFDEAGRAVYSQAISDEEMVQLGLANLSVTNHEGFSFEQGVYMEHHRVRFRDFETERGTP